VFLLDEPLSNLDAQLRVLMRSELNKLHSRLEATMIYVTHDQVEAMSMGDRIVVMKDGLIQQIGSPLEVYNEPVNRFVAGFIGSPSMNFATGVVQEKESKIVVDLETFSLKVPERSQEIGRTHLGKEITIGIRPEHIYVGENSFQGTSKSQPIKAFVEVYEAMGSGVILELSVHENNFVAQVDPNTLARAQENIEMYFDEDRLHLFDVRTGNVLQ
jgi:multiple sugar transport system ATP-binding protein